MLHKQNEKCHLVLGKLVAPGKLLRHVAEHIMSPLVFHTVHLIAFQFLSLAGLILLTLL